MAKLVDAKQWLARTLDDSGRANSLITQGRDQGLFSKTKRGGNAPDLVLDDYAKLAATAMSHANPTKIGAAVTNIWEMKFSGLEFAVCDHPSWRPYFPSDFPSRLEKQSLPDGADNILSHWFKGYEKAENHYRWTLGAALIMLFCPRSPHQLFHSYDSISMREHGPKSSCEIRLSAAVIGDENAAATTIRLHFDSVPGGFDDKIIAHQKVLHSGAMNDLLELGRIA